MGTELDSHIIGDSEAQFEQECDKCGGLIDKFGDTFICYTCPTDKEGIQNAN